MIHIILVFALLISSDNEIEESDAGAIAQIIEVRSVKNKIIKERWIEGFW